MPHKKGRCLICVTYNASRRILGRIYTEELKVSLLLFLSLFQTWPLFDPMTFDPRIVKYYIDDMGMFIWLLWLSGWCLVRQSLNCWPSCENSFFSKFYLFSSHTLDFTYPNICYILLLILATEVSRWLCIAYMP